MILYLGISEDNEHKMRILIDTGAVINTGNLKYHMWIISQCPEIVDTFLQCSKDTDYDIVYLLTDLDLDDVVTDANYGQMTAVIRYKRPYTVTGNVPFFLCFALGNNVSLRNVLGLPTLLAMSTGIDLVKGLLSYVELNRSFPLDLKPPGKELPEGSTLNHYSHTMCSV